MDPSKPERPLVPEDRQEPNQSAPDEQTLSSQEENMETEQPVVAGSSTETADVSTEATIEQEHELEVSPASSIEGVSESDIEPAGQEPGPETGPDTKPILENEDGLESEHGGELQAGDDIVPAESELAPESQPEVLTEPEQEQEAALLFAHEPEGEPEEDSQLAQEPEHETQEESQEESELANEPEAEQETEPQLANEPEPEPEQAEPQLKNEHEPENQPNHEPKAPSSEDRPRPWLNSYPEEIPASLEYPNHSIACLLTKAAESYPDHEAIYFMGKSISYRNLLQDANRLANGLISLGVSQGDRVAIMLPNCPQAVAAYFGVLLLGAVVVQTNPLYVERELQHQLSDSGASAIITADLFYARLARVRGEHPESGPLPKLRHVIVTSIKDGLPFPKNLLYPLKQRKEGFRADIPYGSLGIVAYKRLLGASSALPVVTAATGDDLALLQYTGGTTGTPKGVMLTHRNLVANTLQTEAWCYKAQDGNEKFLAALPLFHVFGLTVLMNMSVKKAGSLLLLPRFEVPAVLQAIDRLKPTSFSRGSYDVCCPYQS